MENFLGTSAGLVYHQRCFIQPLTTNMIGLRVILLEKWEVLNGNTEQNEDV